MLRFKRLFRYARDGRGAVAEATDKDGRCAGRPARACGRSRTLARAYVCTMPVRAHTQNMHTHTHTHTPVRMRMLMRTPRHSRAATPACNPPQTPPLPGP